MKSLQRHEGYLLLDNRASAGVPDSLVLAHGLPPGAGRGVFEAATYTCNHCNAIVVKNPLRVRERGFCRKCNHHICDACEAVRAQSFECKPMEQVIDETLNAASHFS